MAPNLSELVSGCAYNSNKGAARFFKWGVPQTPENNTKVLLKVRGLTRFLNGAPAPTPGVTFSALSLPSLFKGSGSCPQAVCGTHDSFVSTTSPAHLKPLNRRWVSGCCSKVHLSRPASSFTVTGLKAVGCRWRTRNSKRLNRA